MSACSRESKDPAFSIFNSLKYAGIATLLDVIVGAVAAWIIVRSKIYGRSALDGLCMLPLAVPGLILAAWTMSLFIRFGDGTAAPWDPPQKLVIRGPYRHVRNPMISGVLFLLIAESMFFDVSGLLVWTTVFFVGNSVYFPLVEEPGLRKRFGDDYKVYFRNVGRWIPRLTPWSPAEDC